MDRREFLSDAASLSFLVAAMSSGLVGCSEKRSDLSTLVKKTDEGVLLDYEIIPKDKKNRFKNYAFTRLGGNTLYSPLLSDERWLEHYKNLRGLFGEPLEGSFASDSVDPLFGMFAYRVHPATLVPRYHHTGIDIFKPVGTDVKAVHEGVVDRHKDSEGGNWVKVTHPIKTQDGYHLETRYLHLNTINDGIVDGVKVTKGQSLGKLGGTGVMEGYFPHLHLEVVMINDEGTGQPLVLDANRIYFDPTAPTGFFQKFFPPSQRDYFRSLTRDIRTPDVAEKLADLINVLSCQDKRFFPLFLEYWKHAAGKNRGQGQHSILLQRLK